MTFNFYLIWALLLAALVPLALIATRNELRKVRYRLVVELRTHLFKDVAGLPQLELAEARYRSENDAAGETRQSLVRIWTGALIFIAISFVGFSLLLVPRAALLSLTSDPFPRITDALLWGVQSPVAPYDDLARTVTVLAVAFLGGYVFQIRYLMRATLNQELGALAFVRATIYLIQGMIVALIAYRATTAIATPQPSGGTFAVALAVAFVLGFFPNIGIARITKLAGISKKEVNKEMLEFAKIVPLEVIDGIDAETAYRLEESNLIDVQNLATSNPISLYAETPFTLLEVFDWVLQAQLCANVGADAFIALKKHNIRTIFDLERAVLAEGAPEAYVRAIGAVIFGAASIPFRLRVGLPQAADDAPVASVQISVETVRHAVAIMCDDLHVHRLRALWRIMLKTTAGVSEGDSPWLYETGALPGDACFADTPLKAPAGALVSLAAHYGGEYAILAAAPATPAALTAKRAEALDSVRRAITADPAARERLRRLWSPAYLRKRGDESLLEPFFDDADFKRLLAA
jgi:hypothetical protein